MIIRHGDCIAEMSAMLDEGVRVDAVVTDPPYELGFMGKGWDSTGIANLVETWLLALELLKPGGHLLAFSGTRTQHRMVCAIEDAGFEIRDQIGWLYGTGFPKSLDVSKAIDKAAGAEREVVGSKYGMPGYSLKHAEESDVYGDGLMNGPGECAITAPATDAARQWAGWGTALKPAWEPICVARKPLEGTVAANVLAHGTGALNIDGCRVETETPRPARSNAESRSGLAGTGGAVTYGSYAVRGSVAIGETTQGRWPANCIHDGSVDEPWARYFYSSKASKADRAGSKHPTVKPISLMRYLCRLVTPPGGLILDPFAGSGTTLEAAALEGFRCIGIEREVEYYRDCLRRIERTRADLGLFAAE